MKRNITVWVIALSLSLSSCFLNTDGKKNGKVDLQQFPVDSTYSMGVPSFMTKTKSLNENSTFQFQNMFKETYVIVIDENTNEFIDAYKEMDAYDTARSVVSNYADTQVQLITSNMNVIEKKEVTFSKINGLDAAATEIDASLEGVKLPVTYFLTFIEGKEKLYMVMAWTLQNRKENHRATFEQMARSFNTTTKERQPKLGR